MADISTVDPLTNSGACKMIRKTGNRYQVLSKDGKVLGTHDTKKDAEAQLAAIEASKKAAKRK